MILILTTLLLVMIVCTCVYKFHNTFTTSLSFSPSFAVANGLQKCPKSSLRSFSKDLFISIVAARLSVEICILDTKKCRDAQHSSCSAAVLSVLGIFSSGAIAMALYLEHCSSALASYQKSALYLEHAVPSNNA
ncbi:hypothetical protein TorRG33x02_204550 [Trema orientale]|uniref:CASP-like protein n=1 Tax=Trema orientale TaxID=63057 RepID=A0A2P5EE15_TREOI|nr:hypothetical protein TorRG33x02_204550 [Trema orientale]